MSGLATVVDAERQVKGTHPAIDHVLRAFSPKIAKRAAPLISSLLKSRVGSGAPACWSGSPLTGDGFPLEFSFCTADDRLRFTVEPGAPTADPATRLDVAIELLNRAGPGVTTDLVDLFKTMQHGRQLKYGAWIGGRVSSDCSALKLYVEVPEDYPAGEWSSRLGLDDRVATARMLACTPGREGIEIYFRIPSLEPRHVPAVLGAAGLEARASELLELVAETYGCAIRGRLPGTSVGVSYVLAPRITGPVSLHFFARALWGADARIYQMFPRLAARTPWKPDAYLQASAPIATRDIWQTYHGMVGITVGQSDMAFTIGLRPAAA